ncbi:unnamed protein product [Nezara viridula]|uniref:Protein shuttle craft n=1 Tax=Nezara viridula TaxID=85310 RepID=A0A9P0EC22_NEZVI|nr:unnamed protein product [Nezara viridula]
MSNWDRPQSSGSSYQGYGGYYNPQSQPDNSNLYGNLYQQPYYNGSCYNGPSQAFRNGYQGNFQTPPTSAEEFFRIFQEQQHQESQLEYSSRSIDYDSLGRGCNIPTMVFPSSNTGSGGEQVQQGKRKIYENSKGGGRGGGRYQHGAVPRQQNNNFRRGGYSNVKKGVQNQHWAAVPNGDVIGDDSKIDETKNSSKRGKGFAQRNSNRFNGYQKDSGTVKRDNFSKDWRARGKGKGNEECQRDRLTSQLYSGALECLVCCERMRQADPVWSCPACHHVLHLRCTVRWASSSRADNGWRCPACQNVTDAIPTDYKCMCGKVINPQWVRGETPHTCGQVCGKDRGCPHSCTLLCHPGPCPPCSANIDRYCGCNRTKQVVQCSSRVELTCDSVCEKLLNCKVHRCTKGCHNGACEACDKTVHQRCHCGHEERDVPCDHADIEPFYSCDKLCDKLLACGQHKCTKTCHPDCCSACVLSPEVVLTCPCGKKPLPPGSRKSCKDPVPLCGAVCGKVLMCGAAGRKHTCAVLCHSGDCPPCPETTSVMCRCGAMAKEVPCAGLDSRPDDARCSKRCTKKRSCGKHKCNQACCIEIDHFCPLPCNKMLSCGRHRCQELCHRGNCRPCLAASFTELSCECGKAVLYPPVPCGTRPPECKAPCSRDHPCGHPPTHHCHSLSDCPPCSVLTTKYCFGAHELRKTVPCHIGEFSCGRACNKKLDCGHCCIKICHSGPCTPEGTRCVQPCTVPRPTCGHECAAPCHPGQPCNPQPCQSKVEVRCECGRRIVKKSCSENSSEYQRLATAQLASQMADVRLGKTVDLRSSSKPVYKLECTDECKVAERNLRLAIGLQISNPDLSSKLCPRYSQFLMTWAKKDPKFAQNVHDKLTEVVQLAKTSKQKSRSYSFPSMKSEKRQFIHEYSEHFGVESVAYDAEPNRNVVATAYKDKSWLPSYSVLEMLERAAGKRKVPSLLPSLKKDSKEESVMVPVRLRPKSEDAKAEEQKADEPPPIDYFDYVNPSQS